MAGRRQRGVGIAALGRDHAAPRVHRPPVGQGVSGIGVEACEVEHLAGERERDLDDVGGASARQDLDGLTDLQRVAGGEAERDRHVGEQGRGAHAVGLAEADHRAGELAGPVLVGEEGAGAHLHVEHQGVGSLGDLLAHDRRGDERDGLDGAGDVAQGVELAVGRRQVVPGTADDRTDVAQHAHHLVGGELGAPAGDRLELVERAAGVPEPAARQLGHGRATGRDERAQHQRDLVADASRGVLVDGGPPDARQVEAGARRQHRRGPAGELGGLHAPPHDRHEQGRGLLVGDVADGVGLDEPVDLLVGQPPAVALGADDVDGVH